MKKLLGIVVVAIALAAASPAQAESITLSLNGTSQGTFACTGTNGCFGNDITLDVSGSGTSWTVTLTFDTTGNTNAGAGIAAVSVVLTGFSYNATDVTLTDAPPGGSAGDWLAAPGPASASGAGCNAVSSNSICSFDSSAINSGTGLDATLGSGATYTWVWTINNQTFGGFDENTHIQALFGNVDSSCSNKCFNGTGLISTNVPEPGTLALLGLGLLGLGGAARRRLLG